MHNLNRRDGRKMSLSKPKPCGPLELTFGNSWVKLFCVARLDEVKRLFRVDGRNATKWHFNQEGNNGL